MKSREKGCQLQTTVVEWHTWGPVSTATGVPKQLDLTPEGIAKSENLAEKEKTGAE